MPDSFSTELAAVSARRIGERVPAEVAAVVRLPAVRRGVRKVVPTVPARIENLSVTGIGITAPARPALVRRSVVELEFAGILCEVRVRRAAVTPDPEVTYYGLELVDGHGEVMAEIEKLLIGDEPLVKDLRWHGGGVA